MAIHITVVGFGKEPELDDVRLLQYCGFGAASEGQIINGKIDHYQVKTEVEDAVVRHICILDQVIDSPDLILVFNAPFGEDISTETQAAIATKMGLLLSETALRCGSYDLLREVEGMFADEHGNFAFVLKNVSTAVEQDIANGRRDEMIDNNKPNKSEG